MLANIRPLFFDTVVLSNFACVKGGIPLLVKKYHHRGKVTFQVLQEIAKASYSGWEHLDEIENELFQKSGFEKISLNAQEHPHYLSLLRNLGDGEASCIAVAKKRNGIVVTDDRAARNFCKEQDIPITGTLGILKSTCLENSIKPDEADKMLKDMISFGFYSPIHRISDIL